MSWQSLWHWLRPRRVAPAIPADPAPQETRAQAVEQAFAALHTIAVARGLSPFPLGAPTIGAFVRLRHPFEGNSLLRLCRSQVYAGFEDNTRPHRAQQLLWLHTEEAAYFTALLAKPSFPQPNDSHTRILTLDTSAHARLSQREAYRQMFGVAPEASTPLSAKAHAQAHHTCFDLSSALLLARIAHESQQP